MNLKRLFSSHRFIRRPVRGASVFRFPFSVLLLLLTPLLAFSQGGSFRIATESQIPLTIAQEAENAIDKGQRWLAAQPPPPEVPARILRRYALAPAGQPFTLRRCDLTPLEQAMPPPTPPNTLTNLTAALTLKPSPEALFALQRDLPDANPPSDWRQRLTLTLIDSQQTSAQGGHWGDAESTAWALLTLRALLNASPPIVVE